MRRNVALEPLPIRTELFIAFLGRAQDETIMEKSLKRYNTEQVLL